METVVITPEVVGDVLNAAAHALCGERGWSADRLSEAQALILDCCPTLKQAYAVGEIPAREYARRSVATDLIDELKSAFGNNATALDLVLQAVRRVLHRWKGTDEAKTVTAQEKSPADAMHDAVVAHCREYELNERNPDDYSIAMAAIVENDDPVAQKYAGMGGKSQDWLWNFTPQKGADGRASAGDEVHSRVQERMKRTGEDYQAAFHAVLASDPILKKSYLGVS